MELFSLSELVKLDLNIFFKRDMSACSSQNDSNDEDLTQAVIEKWRIHYNTRGPYSALGYRPPAPLTIAPSPPTLDGATIVQ